MKSILKKIKKAIKKLLGVYNYDVEGTQEIIKMYSLYHKGDRFSRFKAQRLCIRIRNKYGIYLDPKTKIGKGLYIAHCCGIRIGKTTEIGDNCRIYPDVHIVSAVVNNEQWHGQRRHAKIGNDCILGINSTIIGRVTIGDDVTIGACALVTKDIPSHTVVKGTNTFRYKRLEEVPDKYKENYRLFLEDHKFEISSANNI